MKPSTAVLLMLAAFVLPAASMAGDALPEWNQERVTALAQDFSEPLQALMADLESRPSVPGNEAARAAIIDVVERLQVRSRDLAQRLASGAGRAETIALFREIESLQSEAGKRSREYPAPFDMHVYIDRVQETTSKLVRYYGEPSDSRDGSDR